MASPCAFCQIIAEPEGSHIIYDDANILAFLDIRPVFLGHTLIVPKIHSDNFYDLPPASVNTFFATIQRIGIAVELGTSADGSFIAMNNKVSQSVPHLHVHVIPRKRKDGLRGFFWPRQTFTRVEMAEIAKKIQSHL